MSEQKIKSRAKKVGVDKLVMLPKIEYGRENVNGNIILTVDGYELIEIIESHKNYSAEKLATIILGAVNSQLDNWQQLRKKYFEECVEKYGDIKRISLAPHDLFEWFYNNMRSLR